MDAHKSTDDERDWIYEHLVKGECGRWQLLPDEFTLERHLSPPRDQQHGNTCGAFVGAAMYEVANNVAGSGAIIRSDSGDTLRLSADADGAQTDMRARYAIGTSISPEFIYYHRANKPRTGMFGRDVFNIMRRLGAVSEDEYPYRLGHGVAPSGDLYVTAGAHKIENYARVKTIIGLKRALIELGACYLGLPLYNHTVRFWDKTNGYVVDGGHSVMIYGYNETGFLFRNSWGESWGNGGNGVFPYGDFDVIWEIWVAIIN